MMKLIPARYNPPTVFTGRLQEEVMGNTHFLFSNSLKAFFEKILIENIFLAPLRN